SIVLAFQFFQGHWQIAFYTCLALAVYGILRFLLSLKGETKRGILKFLAMNLVMILFFLSTVAISLVPLASWSRDTNRGVNSGENMGKGGLNRDEAMAWSMPPEEISTFVIPGFFGFSRQEAGENPSNIRSYYWGRMVFTQTTDYMGLLPWLLLPLPFIFRRDKYSWLALTGVAIGLLFSLGKFTPFYNLLYDYLPGINRFRVPKMMMFIPVFALSMLAARGIDCIKDEGIRASLAFKRYIRAVCLLPLVLVLFLAVLYFWREFWLKSFMDILIQPTRYESGLGLVAQRWLNILIETGIAVVFAAIYAAILTLSRIKGLWRFVPFLLILIFLIDVGRVNSKFLFLTDVPKKATDSNTPVLDFLANQPGNYRTLPLADDPMPYAAKKIPVMFTSSPVQAQRWQAFLDAFSFNSSMPNLINLKYLVVPTDEYEKVFKPLGNRYTPVFITPDKSEVILANRGVLPKAWLVTSAFTVQDPAEVYNIIQNPQFNPGNFAIVESPPTVQLEPAVSNSVSGSVETKKYSGEELIFSVNTIKNAIFVIGEKYAEGWKAFVDGTQVPIQQVDYILRGVYLTPGSHEVKFIFDPKSFKIGKWLTLGSFGVFAVMLLLQLRRRKKEKVA
ncbi:MAG: YfhO family protein, partial [Desulfuromonadales bacterium]|nr:YfhO family protein [Desulfuromonadales bacterium]